MKDLLIPQVPMFHLFLRVVLVYLVVLILLRVSGKRQMGQMGATEFVAVLLLSNAVQNAMNGGDNSLTAGLWLALVLISLSTLISFLTYRSGFFRTLFEGTPTLLIRHGKVVRANLDRERLSDSELRALLRRQGVHQIQDIESAILEADGTLTVTRQNDPLFSHPE